MSATLRRTILGPSSFNFSGRRSCHTFGGSITWSSTEMILGNSSGVNMGRRLHLTTRQIAPRPVRRPDEQDSGADVPEVVHRVVHEVPRERLDREGRAVA